MNCTMIAKKLKMKSTKENLRLIKDTFQFVEFKPIPMTVQEFNEQQKEQYYIDKREYMKRHGRRVTQERPPILRDYLFNVYYSEYNKCKPRKIGFVVTINKKWNNRHIFYTTKKLLDKGINKCISRYNDYTNYHYYGSQ